MKKLYFILLMLLMVQIRLTQAQKQEYKFTRINILENASIGQVNFIVEDRYGFIWFSEESNGTLTRFDGHNIKRYQNIPSNSNSLGGNYPECLFIDQNGMIWIGFFGQGLDRFDPLTETFTHYRHDTKNDNSLSNDFVSSIVGDSDGNIYIATFAGLSKLARLGP